MKECQGRSQNQVDEALRSKPFQLLLTFSVLPDTMLGAGLAEPGVAGGGRWARPRIRELRPPPTHPALGMRPQILLAGWGQLNVCAIPPKHQQDRETIVFCRTTLGVGGGTAGHREGFLNTAWREGFPGPEPGEGLLTPARCP